MSLWETITGVVGGGFGIGTIWKFIRKANALRKIFGDVKDVIEEADDLYEELKDTKALCESASADKKWTEEETKQLVAQVYLVLKEYEDFHKELKEVVSKGKEILGDK